MGRPPSSPRVYHITHIDNLAQLVQQGVLWSDAKCRQLGLNCAVVGMSDIKLRRLNQLPVKCHPNTRVGDYVPFYFCPRSIMLYILHMDNNPDLSYHGGQRPIVHLVADVAKTVAWADAQGRPWPFSNRNAGAYLADFYSDLRDLDKINWDAVESRDFRDPLVKEGKQAEFLVYESFAWELVEEIGVIDASVAHQVQTLVSGAIHRPPVRIERAWYY